MSRGALHIRRVAVDRLYGIALPGLHCEELSPGVNVIYGPNAQGKTSLGHAIHGLIWPSTLRGLRAALNGRFELGDSTYDVVIEGEGAAYRRDGADSAPPTVPDPEHRARYWLPLHKLLQAEDNDFAEIIRRTALGGLDVEAAAAELGFQPASTRRRAATQTVDTAFARVKRVEDQQRAKQSEEEGLASMRRELAEAIEAEQLVRLYDRAIAYAAARQEAAAARELVQGMPEAIANAREDDARQLRQLRAEIAEARSRRETTERKLAGYRATRESNIVVASGHPSSPLAKLEEQQSVLGNLESGLYENRRAAAAARATEQGAWSRIEGAVSVEAAERIDVGGLRDVDDFIEEVESYRAESKSLTALERALGQEAPAELEREIRSREEAISALREWLRRDQDTERQSGHARIFAAIGAILFAGSAVAAVALDLYVPAGVAAAAAICLGAIWVMLPGAPAAQGHEEEQLARREIDPPARWALEEVTARLAELESETADLRLRLRMAQRREALQPDAERLAERRAELQARREVIAERLGIEPPLRETQLRLFLDSLSAWQKAGDQRRALEADLAETERRLADVLADINAAIAPFGIEPVGTGAEAKAAIEEIEEAYRELAAADREIERETTALDSITTAEFNAQKRIDAIFERLKLDPDVGDDVVVALCDQIDDFRARHREFEIKQQRASDTRRQLEAEAAFTPALLDEPIDALREAHAAARTRAGAREDLLAQISVVENEIAKLRREHNLEEARAEYAVALDTLEREFDHAADAAVGHLMADHLIERSREDQLPLVFARARDLFGRITHGRYRLELDRRNGRFYATDTVRDRAFQLNELSSGTRVQLLLAVRIAFVEEQELGSRLPLVLDEALAISDDERAQAILDAILALAREGRQIFYFTAQHDEVAKWKRVLDGVDHRLIPLGDAARPEDISGDALPGESFGRRVPAPEGRDRREYAQTLQVPRWHAHMPVHQAHLWYFLDDPQRLHDLLARGFVHWGQVEALAEGGALEVTGIDERTYAAMRLKAEALKAWQRCWRTGRGRPIDRDVLAECPAVTTIFLDRVAELCDELEGDGRELLEHMRRGAVTGFRSNKMDELEDFLLEHGYIDNQGRLSHEEIWTEVVSVVFESLEGCGLSLDDVDRFLADVREGPPRTAEQVAVA